MAPETDKATGSLIARATRTAALTVVGVAIALLSFELAVRLAFPAFEPSGRFNFTYRVDGNLILGSPGIVARQRKNAGDYDVTVRINARGLRDDKDVARATTNDIAVVGDSFAWGWGVQAEERFSDRLQKLTGKRVFKMAPIHHHFERLGWAETQITFRFWVVGAIGGILGIVAFLALENTYISARTLTVDGGL